MGGIGLAAGAIEVVGMTKRYRVPEREEGRDTFWRALVRRRYRTVEAVSGLHFRLAPGEVVGFLGPNGAGKTTALKCLAGLLHPSEGRVTVLGHVPWRRERSFLRRISFVMGQKSQLIWDLPPSETFALQRAIYDLEPRAYRAALDELVALLDLTPLLGKPVRQLSLGERMRCELAAALLHRPQVLFLDEPTLGLDVIAQARVRSFLREYNRRSGATILLTSHYMEDVRALCPRVLVINRGRLLYDGELAGLVRAAGGRKRARLQLADPLAAGEVRAAAAEEGMEIAAAADSTVTLLLPSEGAAERLSHLLERWPVADLTIEEPPIEEVIAAVFQGERLA